MVFINRNEGQSHNDIFNVKFCMLYMFIYASLQWGELHHVWTRITQHDDQNARFACDALCPSSFVCEKKRYLQSIVQDLASFYRTIHYILYLHIIWLFPFTPCPDRKVWLEVWFGGMVRGYDSRVWFGAVFFLESETNRVEVRMDIKWFLYVNSGTQALFLPGNSTALFSRWIG